MKKKHKYVNPVCTIIPEKLVSIGGSHFSKIGQDPLVMTVTLLRDMLQNLPELNTHTQTLTEGYTWGLSRNVETKWPHHVLFNVVILCHLDEGLEQSAVVLDEDLTGLTISALEHTKGSIYKNTSLGQKG